MGNAVFFSTYEHVRYHMHRKFRDSSSGVTGLVDMGIGIVSGGLGGIAVSFVFSIFFVMDIILDLGDCDFIFSD